MWAWHKGPDTADTPHVKFEIYIRQYFCRNQGAQFGTTWNKKIRRAREMDEDKLRDNPWPIHVQTSHGLCPTTLAYYATPTYSATPLSIKTCCQYSILPY